MFHLSGAEWVLAVVVAAIGAVVGYLLSENDRRALGRTPWGLPSLVWALFWCLSLVVGVVLYLIAHSSEVRRAQRGAAAGYPGVPGQQAATGSRATTVAEQFPAYPQPANRQPDPSPAAPADPSMPNGSPAAAAAQAPVGSETPAGSGEGTPIAGASPEGTPIAGASPGWTYSPPGWHADPSGRFHYRWWDGHQWTSHVSADGQHLIDTSPDQRIGPY